MIPRLAWLYGFLFLICSAQAIAMPARPGDFFQTLDGQASPNLAWWAAAPFTDPSGTLWLGVDGAGPDGIVAAVFDIPGLDPQIIPSRSYHPDRNVVAFWLAIPQASFAGSEIMARAAVLFEADAIPLQSEWITVSRNERGWQSLQFEAGWTSLSPSADSRLIYVAANGDDHLAGFPHDGGVRPRMSEADAKLAARRYHAFTAFIQSARENRKGRWDDRYTAGALNLYIREGFNRPLPGFDGSRPIPPSPYLLPAP